jgi:organic hydroperoxide reductase OsmC/OhrA
MAEHHTNVSWRRYGGAFARNDFNRDHTATFEGGQVLDVSSAPDYGGNAAYADPEQLFLAALSSCHMLTFLAVSANRGLVVEAYDDDASCALGKDENGRTMVIRATLRPTVRFAADKRPSPEDFAKLHERAHQACFIANSSRTPVVLEPQLLD